MTVKLAAFAAFLRVLALSFEPLGDAARRTCSGRSRRARIVVGNVMAVIQENVKRLLAYSSIAHAGYLLIGFVPGTAEGYSAGGVLPDRLSVHEPRRVRRGGGARAPRPGLRAHELARRASRSARPGLAALMTLFMLALAGIPGTAGFTGEVPDLLGRGATRATSGSPILGVLMSVVSVYYYLRVPVLMYMRDPGEETPRRGARQLARSSLLDGVRCGRASISACVPNGSLPVRRTRECTVLDWARHSVASLMDGTHAAVR